MTRDTRHAPLLIAHRGASEDAPENTLPAFRLGAAQGADGIECDVRLTRDQRVVVIHDANTRRTTGVSREVAGTTWRELQRLDAGRWKGPAWAGTRIPLLAEVLDALPAHLVIQVEVKSGPATVPLLLPLLHAVPHHRRRVTVIAFDPEVVRALKAEAPEIRALWLTAYKRRHFRWHPGTADMMRMLAACGADGLGSQDHASLTPARVTALRDAGRTCTVWTVDRPANARRLQQLGVEAIATNRPGRLRAQLGW